MSVKFNFSNKGCECQRAAKWQRNSGETRLTAVGTLSITSGLVEWAVANPFARFFALNFLDISAVLLGSAALFSYLNHKLFRLPPSIGLTLAGLFASALVIGLDRLLPAYRFADIVRTTIESIHFPELLMRGALGFLLFAGAMELNLNELLERKWPVLILALAGTALSTVLMGFLTKAIVGALGLAVPTSYCFVFGALISPTDPIAVLGLMKTMRVSKDLEVTVAGESLFNDGVGVVLFSVALAFAGAREASATEVAHVFAREVMGGLLLGFGCGLVVYRAMKTLDEPNLEVFLSLALVMIINFAAVRLEVSAPLACVVAGLFIGNQGRRFAMSDPTREALEAVWNLIDYVLNAALFLLVGLEVVTVQFKSMYAVAGLLLAVGLIVVRLISVWLPLSVARRLARFKAGTLPILVWGGLRGAISLAMALSLPDFPSRPIVLSATYGVVLFSVLVQGLTVRPLIARYAGRT